MASSRHAGSKMVALRLTPDDEYQLLLAKHKMEKELRRSVNKSELVSKLASWYVHEEDVA